MAINWLLYTNLLNKKHWAGFFAGIWKTKHTTDRPLLLRDCKKFNISISFQNHEQSSDVFFVYLKCESVGYWFIVVICQNQLTIFIHIRSATIADYTVINYLLQALVFLAKIGIHGIISGSKNSKLIFLYYKLLTNHMKRYLTGLFDILTLHSIRFSCLFIEIEFRLSRKQFDAN